MLRSEYCHERPAGAEKADLWYHQCPWRHKFDQKIHHFEDYCDDELPLDFDDVLEPFDNDDDEDHLDEEQQ